MGAIIGILQHELPINKAVLLDMQKILQHRGTDESGVYVFEYNHAPMKAGFKYGGLGFNYSYVKKQESNSSQSITSDDQQVIILMDGVIYNAEELRQELQTKGCIFIAKSDLELLLTLYLRDGIERMLEVLDGVFALSIYDSRTQVMYIVRDRIGEKPLYYYQKESLFLFASEYKAFYCHPEFKAKLNEKAVSEYFLFRYPAGETTFLQDVYLLAPGTYMTITSNTVESKRYWDIPCLDCNQKSFKDNKEILKDLLNKSVKRRLIPDIPIGVQLSGGIDSSLVASIAKKEGTKDLKSFAIIFDNQEMSEEKYIDYVNAHLNLPTQKLNFSSSDFLDNLVLSTWHYESPMNHEGNIALTHLNREASKEVSILLCGDGADECLGGYPHILRAITYNDHQIQWKGVQVKNILKGKHHYICLDDWFISRQQYITDEQISKLRPKTYRRDIRQAYKTRRNILNNYKKCDKTHQYLNYSIRTYLLDTLLRGDKLSLASSLELRASFLMPELIEFLQTVPTKQLVDSSKPYMYGTKVLLKSLCEDEFGKEFTYRPKIGLGMPMHELLSGENVKAYIESSVLPGIKKRGVVNYDYVLSIWKQLPSITTAMDKRLQVLWTVISFEVWAQLYLDNSPLEYVKNQ